MTAYRPFPINGLRVPARTPSAACRARIRSIGERMQAVGMDAAINEALAFTSLGRGFTLDAYEAARAAAPSYIAAVAA